MNSFFLDKKFITRNLLVWGTLFLFFLVADLVSPNKTGPEVYWALIFFFGVAMVIFYTNFRLFELFFISKRWVYFLSLFLLLVLFFLFIYWRRVLPFLHMNLDNLNNYIITVFGYSVVQFLLVVLVSSFYWSVLFANRQIKRNTEIQLALHRVETEKAAAEKRFLQSQVNPHFLYNTLNFFYARSLDCSKELSEGIMTLSSIMRYALEQKENEQGLVALEDEVEHLRNVIYINQLRFNMKLQIRFSITGSIEGVRILPFVLITLVENAIKHGELQDSHHPVRVDLVCDHAARQLSFSVYNLKREGPKEVSTGIGLENTGSRLKWAYKDLHSFQTIDEAGYFSAQLKIPLYTDDDQLPGY